MTTSMLRHHSSPTVTSKKRGRVMTASLTIVTAALLAISISSADAFSSGSPLALRAASSKRGRLQKTLLHQAFPSSSSNGNSHSQNNKDASINPRATGPNSPPIKKDKNGPASSSSSALSSSVGSLAMPRQSSTLAQKEAAHVNYHWTSQNLAIALPALLGLLSDPLLSMVDTAFVGRVSAVDLAALGVCTSIFHMCFTIFRASTVATTSLVGSAKSESEARQITKISLTMGGVLGILMTLALRLGGPLLLSTMGVSRASSMYRPACDYLFARCWAAPAVVGVVVAEGAFRGRDDSKTPLVAAAVAGLINLILDPLLMFPLKLGMAGAAIATALSQVGGFGLYAHRLRKRKLLPQPNDVSTVKAKEVVSAIASANLACMLKQGSMLIFYTMATALATRMGPMHVAAHQIALSFWWLITFWLDSGSVSGQVLMAKSTGNTHQTKSLVNYMLKYAAVQGIAFTSIVAAVAKVLPLLFTQDPTITLLLHQILPYVAVQQVLVSLCLVLEGLAIGANEFRHMAVGTAVATGLGLWKLLQATSVVDIWGTAVTTFFGARLVNAALAVAKTQFRQPTTPATISTATAAQA